MAGAQLGTVLRHIQQLFSGGSTTGVSDTHLLRRFATQRDEGAFTALVARHGPMVLAVCRGILRNPFDAEDAFQATFLVLAKRAGSGWAEGQLGGWLHRVAYRIAIRASADAIRRRKHEESAAAAEAIECPDFKLDDDLRKALHEELARLPEKFRLPLVLCYLEGMSHQQASLALRCGEATLRRRLAAARERLRERLVRNGCAPAAMALNAVLTSKPEAVPPLCAANAIRAAMRVAAGEAVVTVVSAQMRPFLHGGWNVGSNGWKVTASALLFGAAIAGMAVGIGAAIGKSAPPPPRQTNEPVTASPSRVAADDARPARHPVPQAATPPPQKASQKHTIKGQVLGPDGKPVSAATVYWRGYRRFQRSQMTRPKGFKEKPEDREQSLALGRTNSQGRFELEAEFDPDRFPGRMVIVKPTGAGLREKRSSARPSRKAPAEPTD
jgi:RNA polymerase sigma factor (sigma-70 family)